MDISNLMPVRQGWLLLPLEFFIFLMYSVAQAMLLKRRYEKY